MKKIKSLLLWFFYFGVYAAEISKDFFKSVNTKPFYIITIARETPEDIDYPQLTEEQKSLVFNALCRIFDLPNELDRTLMEYVESKELLFNQYRTIKDQFYAQLQPFIECSDASHASILHEYLKRKSDFDFFFTIPQIQNDLLRCQTIEDVKVLISSVIANSSREIAAFVPANKKSTYVAGDDLKRNTKGNMVLQKQLLEYIDVTKISKYFDDELQSKMKQHH